MISRLIWGVKFIILAIVLGLVAAVAQEVEVGVPQSPQSSVETVHGLEWLLPPQHPN